MISINRKPVIKVPTTEPKILAAFDYDLALLAVPIALIARRGMQEEFRPWEKSLLVALWTLPLIARPASIYHLPVTPILLGLSLTFFARSGATNDSR
jgi:hypothetical protein